MIYGSTRLLQSGFAIVSSLRFHRNMGSGMISKGLRIMPLALTVSKVHMPFTARSILLPKHKNCLMPLHTLKAVPYCVCWKISWAQKAFVTVYELTCRNLPNATPGALICGGIYRLLPSNL